MTSDGRSLADLPARFSRWLAWVAGALILFGCALLITVEVIGRQFGVTVHSFEISSYAFAGAIGLGSAFTVTSKSNIRVDILVDKLPRPLRIACDLIAAVALAVAAATLAWYALGTVQQSWRIDARSTSILAVPLAIPQGVWCAGIVGLAAMSAFTATRALVALLTGRASEAERLIGTLRVAEEIEQAGVRLPPAGDGR